MATENLNFAASVEDWVKSQKEAMRVIALESTQKLVSVIQNTPFPVDTGFARASVRASLSEMPAIDPSARPKEGATYTYDPAVISASIVGLQLGQTIHVGWTASYVQYLEYGHSKQAPSGMVRIGCAQWPAIVAEVSQEAKSLAA